RVLLRRPVGANHVPTGSPASACAALSAAVSTTGTPALVAMDAASSLVTMPPVPIAVPRPVTSMFSRSSGPRTSGTRRVPGRGDEGGGPVVAAEAELGGGHGVVFVDDRDDAERERPRQGAVRVAVVVAADEVLGGEEHLAHAPAVLGEGLGVPRHEDALAHRGGRLRGGEVLRPHGQTERRDAGGDGAGGDEDDLLTGVAPVGEHLDERVQAREVEPPVTCRQ